MKLPPIPTRIADKISVDSLPKIIRSIQIESFNIGFQEAINQGNEVCPHQGKVQRMEDLKQKRECPVCWSEICSQ
jgi:hypothetical protein